MGTVAYNLTVLHRHDSPLQLIDNILVVRRQQHSRTVLVDFLQNSNYIPGMLWVKVASRLVGYKYPRLAYDGTGNSHPLALTSR
jgi:hypothetical protein